MNQNIISDDEFKFFQLAKNYPEELGMVIQCRDYDEYASTFFDIGLNEEDIILNEETFNFLKTFFNMINKDEGEINGLR